MLTHCMTNPYLEHPNEEALERFLLNRSGDQELEVLETHILACESCVTRLESLELELAHLKESLTFAEEQRIEKALHPSKTWKDWFSLPNLSWAGAACAALAVGLVVVPHSLHKLSPGAASNSLTVAEGDLSACRGADGASADLATCRGTETATLPQNHPLDLKVDTTDIQPGPVDVQVVNGNGGEVWKGAAAVDHERARVQLPGLVEPGAYFLRLYARTVGSEHELLREYRFEVK